MTPDQWIALVNGAGVSGLLMVVLWGALKGEWVPGYLYRQLVAQFRALQADHAALRAEFDEYRKGHP